MNPNFDDNDDERFRALFRSAEPPLSDNGFSAKVLTALPPPARRHSMLAWSSGGAAVGLIVALANIATSDGWTEAGNELVAAWSVVQPGMVEPLVSITVLVTAVSLGAAWLVIRQHTTAGPLFPGFFRRF